VLSGIFSCADPQIIATVGTGKITHREFDELCKRKAEFLGVKSLDLNTKKQILESMVQREIVYLYAKKNGLKASDEMLREASKGRSFIDRTSHKEDIEKTAVFEQVKKNITSNVPSPKEEIEEYYNTRKEEFVMPATFKIYLVKVSEADAAHVLAKARGNLEAFDDMALKTSTKDLIEINKKAVLQPREDFPQEMWPYLEKMKIGDIGGPIKVVRGIFIFRLVDRRPSSVKPLKEAYSEIEELFLPRKKDEAFEKWYNSVKGDFKITIKAEI
jgi:peptidyl-prolyl cis-trans isomerase C